MRSWLWLLAPAVIGALVVWRATRDERATSVVDVRRRLAPYDVDPQAEWAKRMRRA
jgi:hypothetical protein